MAFGEAKVYHDGSHYIAIPYVPNPRKKKVKPPEELITVVEEEETDNTQNKGFIKSNEEDKPLVCVAEKESTDTETKENRKERKVTKKEYFEELYEQTHDKKRAERKRIIVKEMMKYFPDKEQATAYVEEQFDRKIRNLICRRTRLSRKVNLQEFNYFCTFTYDSEKHTEGSFQSKLKGCFKMMCHRKNWKYVGVWERSPEKKRLHFHGLFYIPNGAMPGELAEVSDYNTTKHKRQTTLQNSYFAKRFGRNDFSPVDDRGTLCEAMTYLMKYIEKTGEKIVYSKGLPQYFISDIMDDDIVCTIGQEDKKVLLFDDFTCWDEGCYVGKVSKEVIAQMRKSN